MFTQKDRLWLEQQEQQPWKTAEEIENNREQRLERYKEGKRKLAEQVEQAFLGGDIDKVLRMIEFPLRKRQKRLANTG